jgi:hypothetical protein
MLANYGRLNLECALDSYQRGRPVIVKANDGGILHGQETLKAIIETGTPLECAVIDGVDRKEFESTDWPEVLESFRLVFMQDGFSRTEKSNRS